MGIYLGLISGTSVDASDAALVDFDVAPLSILGTAALIAPNPLASTAALGLDPDEARTRFGRRVSLRLKNT